MATGRLLPYTAPMGRKRRKLVVTITETWTFVFADEGPPPVADQPAELPAFAPTPTPPAPAPPAPTDLGDEPPPADGESTDGL